jgi:hypothetical protein
MFVSNMLLITIITIIITIQRTTTSTTTTNNNNNNQIPPTHNNQLLLSTLENVWNCRAISWSIPTIKPLRFIRCGNPSLATMNDSNILHQVFPNVKTLIDLRSYEEIESDFHLPRHFHKNKFLYHLPLGDRSTIGSVLVRRANLTSLISYLYRRLILQDLEGAKGEMIPYMNGLLGLNQLILEHEGKALGRVLKLLVKSEFPVLIYCTAGKDRTGLVTALALSAAGVSKEHILEDYELSNLHRDTIFSRAMQSVMPNGISHSEARSWAAAPRQVMIDTLEYIDKKWGSMELYLDSIGFHEGWRSRLRSKLYDDGDDWGLVHWL